MNLVLVLRSDGRMELRPSRLFRGLLALIALITAAAAIASAADGAGPTAMPLILFAAALLASLYEERWIFSASGAIENRHGLLLLNRVRRYEPEAIEGFRLSSFTKGRLRGTDTEAPPFLPSFVVLAVDTSDSGPRTIEILRYGKKERLEARAAKIAAFCSKPLTNEIG